MTRSAIALPRLRHPVRTIGRRQFDFDHQVVVMGIVNRTPDSFFDQGHTFSLDAAVSAALAAATAGAGWVDIGGVPFSPDTPEVGEVEEIDRVVGVVEAVAAASDVAISVDTYRPEVARRSIAAGAAIINDTTGLADPEMADVVARSGASLVITHSRAEPHQRFPRPRYADVVSEVKSYLSARIEQAVARGVGEEQLIIDPGHDLNKNTLHSLELTRRLNEIASIGLPMLAAVSNKDFIGESTGLSKDQRTEASLAAASVCVMLGARIVRVHNVPAALAAVSMLEAVLGLRQPSPLVHNMA